MSQPRRDRSNPKPRRGAPKRGRRPFIDILEERAVPATFTVTTTDDSGAGSLRAAIALAAANEEADTIDFAPSLAGQKIALTSNSANTAFGPTALTIVDDDVTIDGAAARLLEIGARLVRPGGHLTYVVCSLLREEGMAQAEAFLARHPGLRPALDTLPAGTSEGCGWRLTPARDGTDGFFIARFLRPC